MNVRGFTSLSSLALLALSACAPEEVPARRDDSEFVLIPGGPGDAGASDAGAPSPTPTTDAGSRPDVVVFDPIDASAPRPPPTATTCERACAHVYRDCGFSFRASNGAAVSEAQCVAACNAGQFMGAEACLATTQCTSSALNACFTGAPPAPTPDSGVPTDAGSSAPPSGATALEDQVLALTNQRRAMGANCGGQNFAPAPALRGNETLRAVARAHSTDMGTRRYFDHNSLDGRTPFQRMMAAGYNSSPMGENIAAGNATAEATVTQWLNSPGHCRNIMNPSFRALGVGYANVAGSQYRHYWTQNFGGM
jgi:uncharacterized protein YkwD